MVKLDSLKKGVTGLLVALICIASFGATTLINPQKAEAASNKGVVFINPGHSPSATPSGTHGVNPNGSVVTEDYMNEWTSKLLGEKLRSLGYTVYLTNIMTVASDLPVVITSPPAKNNSYKGNQYQFSDEPDKGIKGELVPACNNPSSINPSVTVKPDLIVSMHRNSVNDSSANGLLVGYDTNTGNGRSEEIVAKSKYLSDQISSQFSANMKSYFKSSRSVDYIRNSLVKYATAPAVIVEAGFMTNANDLKNMQKSDCQAALVDSIANGVDQYFGKYSPGPYLKGIYHDAPSTTDKTLFDISAVVNGEVSGVQISVWNTSIGRGTSYTYKGVLMGDGGWHATFNQNNHGGMSGVYSIEVYEITKDGKSIPLGYQLITLTTDMVPKATIYYDASETTEKMLFDISAVVQKGTADIKSVDISVWNTDVGRENSTHTYKGIWTGDGGWHATFDAAKHGGKGGAYSIETYATDSKGVRYATGYKMVKVNVTAPQATIYYDAPSTTDKTLFDISAVVQKGTADIKSVDISVWNTDVGRENSTHTYKGIWTGDGGWHATFDAAKHGGKGGAYSIETYATDSKGVRYATGYKMVKVNVTAPQATIYYDAPSTTDKTLFDISAVVQKGSYDIKSVDITVWNTDFGRENSTYTYKAIWTGDGGWHATFDAAKHGGKGGAYSIEVYATDSIGARYSTIYRLVNIGITPIMGESKATVAQMVNFFNASKKTYPASYSSLGTDLQKFAQLYYEICQTEGVRAEVAWAQMCLETGYLQYGGDVQEGQFNFAGLGATGGVPGFDFAAVYGNDSNGIKHGIIGQVQHLKCYASSDEVVYKDSAGKPIDPRWWTNLRSTAPTVEKLSGKWATSKTYGLEIAEMVKRLLTQPKTVASASVIAPPEETDAPKMEESAVPLPTETAPPTEPEYSIMRQETVNVKEGQLINYYIQHAKDLTAEWTDDVGNVVKTDAVTAFPSDYYGMQLKDFVQIYMDEANAEGINPEVAFAQAMKDTDFLRFGNELKMSAYMFCAEDISADTTDTGYDTVRDGVRAQIQHLKWYASTDNCVHVIIDKQWKESERGTINDVALLGAGTWYNDANYGMELVREIKGILTMQMSAEYLETYAEGTNPADETGTEQQGQEIETTEPQASPSEASVKESENVMPDVA